LVSAVFRILILYLMTIDYFVDETFHLPANSSLETFYVFAVVGIERKKIKATRRALLGIANTNWWHSSKVIQTSNGRSRFKNIGRELGPHLMLEIFLSIPIARDDKSGEKTRNKLIKEIAKSISLRDRDSYISIEMRRSGGQLKLDRETIETIHMVRNKDFVRLQSPAQEPLLWLPDMLASSFRRRLLRENSDLLESFGKEVLVTFIR